MEQQDDSGCLREDSAGLMALVFFLREIAGPGFVDDDSSGTGPSVEVLRRAVLLFIRAVEDSGR